MPLHRLTQITLGVPNVDATADYYDEFGLTRVTSENGSHVFATTDGGEQLRIGYAPQRRLLRLGIGVDDPDDLDRIQASLRRLDVEVNRDDRSITALDPGTDVRVVVEIADHIEQQERKVPAYNAPGSTPRLNARADGIMRENRVTPRKLGHVVIGSTDQGASERFFTEGLGLKISDKVVGRAAFMRCSTDHHNVLIQNSPVNFVHHTSWQLDDVDEVGRGASMMLEADPDRHVWGLGRHHIGSNFFWYLKDPAGNFSEYYSDLDCIVDDALWDPGIWEGAKGLYNWGPPPSPSFLKPDDLAALMTGAHSPES